MNGWSETDWLSTEPIKGYRNAVFDRTQDRLMGPVMTDHELTLPESGEATCRSWRRSFVVEHEAPEESCSCGFYALKRLREYGHAWIWASSYEERLQPIILECDLYGKVIEHEHFYRAESYIANAIILNRRYVRKNDPIVQRLRDKYKIEVKVRNVKGAVR